MTQRQQSASANQFLQIYISHIHILVYIHIHIQRQTYRGSHVPLIHLCHKKKKLKEKAIDSQKVSMGKADRKALHILVLAVVHVHVHVHAKLEFPLFIRWYKDTCLASNSTHNH